MGATSVRWPMGAGSVLLATATPWCSGRQGGHLQRRLTPDTWQAQLEELLALQAYLDKDFSLIAAPGVDPPSTIAAPGPEAASPQQQGAVSRSSDDIATASSHACHGCGWLDPEALMLAGPPPDVLLNGGGDGGNAEGDDCVEAAGVAARDGSTGGGGLFVAEALVHVDLPEGGLQLVLQQPAKQPQPSAPTNAPPGSVPCAVPDEAQVAQQPRLPSPATSRAACADPTAAASTPVVASVLDSAAPPRVDSSPAATDSADIDPLVVEAAAHGIVDDDDDDAPPIDMEEPFGPPLQYLSPIRVTLTLPPDYPAASPPALTLDALWLSPRQSAALAAALRSQWEAQGPGCPIAFLWLDWLRSEALSHLGLTQRLVLRDDEDGEECGGGGGGPALTPQLAAAGAAAGAAEPSSPPSEDGSDAEDAAAAGRVGFGEGDDDGAGGSEGSRDGADTDTSSAEGSGGGASTASSPAGGSRAGALAVALLRYSARREQERFDSSLVSCPICLDQQLGSRCVRLPECRHAFCGACLATHLRTQLGQGQLEGMRCPDPGCRRPLPPYVLQQLLEPAEYERWERLSFQRVLDGMADVAYCPRCRQPCLKEADNSVLCPGCFFSFCARCEEPWHPGSPCVDQLALLEAKIQRQKEEAKRAARKAAQSGWRKTEVSINERLTINMLTCFAKRCPTCKAVIEKNGGCDHMWCTRCQTAFLWHEAPRFRNEAEVPKTVTEAILGKRGNSKDKEKPPAVLCRCVVCGQPNAKDGGNNHIHCWCCHNHFCYVCRKWLGNRPGQHFGTGPGRCRQHSPG